MKHSSHTHSQVLVGIIGGLAIGLLVGAILLVNNVAYVVSPANPAIAKTSPESPSPVNKTDVQPPTYAGYSEFPPPGIQRVLITPLDAGADRQIRGRSDVAVRHEFDDKFSANVPKAALAAIKELATVETVGISEVHQAVPLARPVCGDNICQGNEPRTCPSDCPSEEPPPEGRTCSPTNQREYNVLQVNGGQLGDGAGVNVAVLDTGTTVSHLDLDVKLCKDATKRGIRNGCADKSDSAHGTHSTGIVAANAGTDGLGLFGVAPSANLWAIKVCGNRFCFNDDIAAAINFAAEQGANIINMSFGAPSQSTLIKTAIDTHKAKVLFVASSGNEGPGPDTIGYPGANPNVVAVAANDAGKVVALFSSRGIDDGDDSTIVAKEVELSAGGVSVESTNKDGCYSSLSGTSFSSPTVAGLASILWAGNPADTRTALVSFAQDITWANGDGAQAGFDIASGYGLPVAP